MTVTVGDLARAIYAEVYGKGSDQSYATVQPIYRDRSLAAAERVVKLLRDDAAKAKP